MDFQKLGDQPTASPGTAATQSAPPSGPQPPSFPPPIAAPPAPPAPLASPAPPAPEEATSGLGDEGCRLRRRFSNADDELQAAVAAQVADATQEVVAQPKGRWLEPEGNDVYKHLSRLWMLLAIIIKLETGYFRIRTTIKTTHKHMP